MPCLLHGTLSHTTDECEVMKDQAEKMKAMYKVQTPAECTRKHQEWKAKKAPTCNEINEMVAESVMKSVKEIFQSHMKTLKSATARIPIVIVIWNMKAITRKMSV